MALCASILMLCSGTVRTASAAPVTGWGTETGNQNGSPVTSEDGVGGFTMSNSITGNDCPRALFPTISLTNVGDAITLSGTYTFSSGVNYNQQFRFGLFNTVGLATGTLTGSPTNGTWTGANLVGSLGYLMQPGATSGGADLLERRNVGGTGNWFNNAGTTTLVSQTDEQTCNPGTYAFNLNATLMGPSGIYLVYSFNQIAGGTYTMAGTFDDTSPNTTNFNATGFLINASSGGPPLTFSNVDVTYTPISSSTNINILGISVAPTNTFFAGSVPGVNLNVAAIGAPPLHYQWQTDGAGGGSLTNIPNATNSSYAFATATPGTYKFDVVITNSIASTNSAAVQVVVLPASVPILTSDIAPTNIYGFIGGNVSFYANFGLGTMPNTNQWLFSSTGTGYAPVAGAANNPWTVTNVQASSVGYYKLSATNSVGSSNSTPAHLTALADPGAPANIGTNMYAYCV